MVHTNLLNYLPEDLEQEFKERGWKPFRARQILKWIFTKFVFAYDKMSDLPQDFRKEINEIIPLYIPQIEKVTESKDGSKKYLLKLHDKEYIEMVLMPADGKVTLCVSSQVGCARKCRFCATGELGLKRQLMTSEIVGQILLGMKEAGESKLTNIVYMGMGEPMDNLDNVLQSFKIIQHDKCLKFSPRRITVSTCGVTPGIFKLADSGIKVKLAVSLNSALNHKRDVLMPINFKYNLQELKEALKYYSRNSKFRITFEYIMIKNFTMGKEDIKALKKYVGDLSCKLNLIPWNAIPESTFKAPREKEIDAFMKELQSLSCAITVRRSKGSDIDAACGQLAANFKKKRS
jgi:23S rRNA (adenine2503-C2)-methyltransferase